MFAYLLPSLISAALGCSVQGVAPIVSTRDGVIVGTTSSVTGTTATVDKFLGIPFSEPPVGERRWAVPQPPKKWLGGLYTTAFKPSCIQTFTPKSQRSFVEQIYNNPPPEESEDCLYLNVWAPSRPVAPSEPPRAVLFWLYGGGLRFGNAGQPMYDGSHFAALENVIVVSVNYRTNVFGWPFFPAVTNLTERNLGLLDQRLALDWVQENIHAFGGDPKRVTIFGQSAGATSVDVLLTAYGRNSTPPFQAAIMMSGTYTWLPVANCNNTNYSAWNNFTGEIGCANATDQFACAKTKPATLIKDVQETFSASGFSGQACDNITFVSDPRLRRASGNFAPVPVISGTNVQDGSYYAIKAGSNVEKYMNATFNNRTELKAEILAAYPIGSEGRYDNLTQLTHIHTDWNFHCPALLLANDSTLHVPTYRYLYNATFPNTRITLPPSVVNSSNLTFPLEYQRAWHTSDIPLVFSTYEDLLFTPGAPITPEEIALSNTMRGAWASFAKDPSKPPIEGWRTVRNGGEGEEADVMSFGVDGGAGVGLVKDTTGKCGVWKEFFEDMHF
ncbi:Carboxylesterase [Massariosphaeria phaeospora]|uniref:Carboxylic ester hydrolase n=1 Tax=Massariosphaeria phaeospora TaxID=100035 RepID=A0A7C8MEM5_9PLEO|nr:Carboxylesterase [Massariosphaeria phaeospora]